MSAALMHRGHDDSGLWCDANAGIALSHRRLSIIDLSPGGHQPMSSGDGRYVIIYSGEIYNYTEVAERLRQQGVARRTRSDTEVLIEGFARWGVAEPWRCAKACSLWRCGIGSGVRSR
jgi:asparagine synthase (glutamine-hydrolysing)